MISSGIVRRTLLVVALCLSASAAAAPGIVVFGDSLSSGYGLPLDKSWVSLLKDRLRDSGFPHRVINASLSGETTSGGKNRIEAVLAQHRPGIVVLELGGNDGLRGLPPETTQQNLEAIIKACRRAGARVLLVGMELPPNYGAAYTQKFREIFSRLARRYRLALVPFMLEGIGENREWFQPDGIHPTAEAQPLILDNVWKHLRPLLSAR